MSNFSGNWQDQKGTKISVDGKGHFLTVKYGNGRGPFNGHTLDCSHPVIDVDFTDRQPETGVLSSDQKKIYWSNETQWTRV